MQWPERGEREKMEGDRPVNVAVATKAHGHWEARWWVVRC